jgi:hypothetical protein
MIAVGTPRLKRRGWNREGKITISRIQNDLYSGEQMVELSLERLWKS